MANSRYTTIPSHHITSSVSSRSTEMTAVQPKSGVIVAQPTVRHENPYMNFDNPWHAELCDCCDDVSECCYAFCCWRLFLASLATKIGEPSGSCLCVPNALAVYRMKVRSVLRIEGDSFDDCCVTWWCPLCAGLQMHNELRFHNLG